jgi:4-hydroxybenzoate polyprenyltransferase
MNLKSYFDLLRIKHWRGYLVMASFGFVVSKGFLFPLKEILLFFIVISSFFAFGFSINDCFDVKEDKLEKGKKNPIAQGEISFRKGLLFSISLAALGLVLSTFLGKELFLLFLFTTLLAFFYSAPPLRLKSRPGWDLISHGLFAGALIFMMPLLVFKKNLSLFYYLITLSLFYFSITLELRNHLEDYVSDKEAGLKTAVGFLGFERSEKLLRYLAIFYPLTVLPIFWLISEFSYLLLFLILTLGFNYFLFFEKESKIVKSYRLMDAYAHISFLLVSVAVIL